LADLFYDRIRRIMALASAFWFGSSALSGPCIGLWLDLAQEKGLGIWSTRIPYLVECLLIFFVLLLVRHVIGSRGSAAGVISSFGSGGDGFPRPVAQGHESALWIPLLAVSHGLMLLPLMVWANPMIQEKFAASEFRGAVVFASIALGLGLGRLSVAFVTSRWDDLSVLPTTTFVGGFLLFLGLIAPSYKLSLLALSLGSFVSSTTFPCIMSLIGTRFRGTKETVYGYMQSSVAFAGLVGSPLVGILADHGIPLWTALCISPLAAWVVGLISLVWKSRQKTRLPSKRRPAG
jgi:hypothetical protein